ncbi:MAG: hypothetical protein RIQ80_896 [Actinomycetota bacterium]|jgi:ABC-2 type transport system ATP-binding protein
MSNETVIECVNLTKDYGSGHGLFNLNVSISKGEVFGLIGPNGAGKSTFIKLLMDLINPSSGKARIFNLDTRKNSVELKKMIGYLPGELMQFPSVTAGYILNLLMNIRKINEHKYINELAERLQLDLTRKFQDLSHGNKQKVGLIQAFMHKPSLLILDEPTLGLDPIIQRELRNLVQESKESGATVILSSHILTEVESVCSRIGLINNGRVIKEGTMSELKKTRTHMVNAKLIGSLSSRDELEAVGVHNLKIDGQDVSFEVHGEIDRALKVLAKYEVIELDSRELSLEEVFFSEVES